MKGTRKDGNVSSAEAQDALRRILDSGFLSNSPKLEEFLRFVTTEELEGRGEAIGPHAIAVNALGRRESFDPKTDPVVRVFASRLRTALSVYYEGTGIADPIHIELPRGGYRPSFLRVKEEIPMTPQHGAESPSPANRGKPLTPGQLNVLTGLLAATVLAIAAIVFYLTMHHQADDNLAASVPADTAKVPIVAVLPFDAGANADAGSLLEGIRQQLIIDLSLFRSLRVRDMPPAGTASAERNPSEYQVSGRLVGTTASEMLEITVLDTARDVIVWTEMVNLPGNDSEYQDLLLTAIRSIVRRLAGISGIVQSEEVRRLEKRRAELGSTKTSDYECVVIVYDYGQRRTEASKSEARRCLRELTALGSRDSMVWAFWALMEYIDWVERGDDPGTDLLQDGLAAARRAIELDPANANAHEFAGMISASMGEMAAARESYERALALNPSKPDFYVHYGVYFLRLGDWERGVALVREGIALSPSPNGWMRLPLALDAFRRGDYAGSLREAQVTIESGDRRGVLLALAAAAALGDKRLTDRYLADFKKMSPGGLDDPIKQIRKVFADPVLDAKYENVLSGVLKR